MGEFYNGHKLGVCDHLMYVTREELERFSSENPGKNQSAGSMPFLKDYLALGKRWMYRFPRSNDVVNRLAQIDERSEQTCYLEIEMPVGFKVPHKESTQVSLRSAFSRKEITFSFKFCPLDPEHFDQMAPTQLCGWEKPPKELFNPVIEAVAMRYTPTHPDGYTLFRCPCCDMWFSCDEEECDTIKAILHKRGLWYEEKQIRPYYPARDKD